MAINVIQIPANTSIIVSAGVTALGSATSCVAFKTSILVDGLAALTTSGQYAGVLINNHTGILENKVSVIFDSNGTQIRLGCVFGNNGTSNPTVTYSTFFNISSLPGSGSYVVLYAYADHGNSQCGAHLLTSTGTSIVGFDNANDPGALGAGGWVFVNLAAFTGTYGTPNSAAQTCNGIGVFTAQLSGINQYQSPQSADPNEVYLVYMNEGTGTSCAATIGSQALAQSGSGTVSWTTGGFWGPGTVNVIGQQYSWFQGTAAVSLSNVSVSAVGQQENYGTATSLIQIDESLYVDGQQFAWLVGTATVTTSSFLNQTIFPNSQSYAWLIGTPVIQTAATVLPVGQQINWQFGNPTIVTPSSATIIVVGQQYSYAFGFPFVQISSPSQPIVIIPAPGSNFTIESCPKIDTMMMVESDCGQSIKQQTYIYNGVLKYDGTHAYGAF